MACAIDFLIRNVFPHPGGPIIRMLPDSYSITGYYQAVLAGAETFRLILDEIMLERLSDVSFRDGRATPSGLIVINFSNKCRFNKLILKFDKYSPILVFNNKV